MAENSTVLKLKELSTSIIDELKELISTLPAKPKLANIIAGSDSSSLSYMRGMQNRAAKIGLECEIVQFAEDISEADFLKKLDEYNSNSDYAGIIVQVPLPKQINSDKVAEAIDYRKDVDGISPYNQGRLFGGNPFMIPATAYAVDLTLKYIEDNYSYPLQGKNAVVIGRSVTVGKPAFHLLLKRNVTPAITHTRTVATEEITSRADIVVAACGVPELVKESWVKDGAVVIDVGIHCLDADNEKGYRMCGDVNTASVENKVKVVTAVPGGIGAVTSAIVFANTVKGYFKITKDEEFRFGFEK